MSKLTTITTPGLTYTYAKEEAYDLTTVEGRIEWFSEAYEIEPLALTYDPEDPDGGPLLTDAMIAWCDVEGVSIDWLICGSIRGPVSTYREKYSVPEDSREFHALLRQLSTPEMEVMRSAMERMVAGEDGEPAMAECRAEIEALRAVTKKDGWPRAEGWEPRG